MKIHLAYSPDTDDAFMVHALQNHHVESGPYEFSFITADIQTLNERALKARYDVTAISVAAFATIADTYCLMPVGASVGDAFGPALVVPQESMITSLDELSQKRLAVPGRQTSAYFAAVSVLPSFEAVFMDFMKIGDAVLNGDVDAGLIIHEGGLDCESRGFRKIADLGQLWARRWQLPLPLGANAIRRSLGEAHIAAITKILRDSIAWGLRERDATLQAALQVSGADIDKKTGDRYIDMYVNERSLQLHDDVTAGIERLFAEGVQAGLCQPIDLTRSIAPPA